MKNSYLTFLCIFITACSKSGEPNSLKEKNLKGNVKSTIELNVKGNDSSKTVYYYDNNGNLVEGNLYVSGRVFKSKSAYDTRNRLVVDSSIKQMGNCGIILFISTVPVLIKMKKTHTGPMAD